MPGDERGSVSAARLLDGLFGEGVRIDDDVFVEMMRVGFLSFRLDLWTVHPLAFSLCLSLLLYVVWCGGGSGCDDEVGVEAVVIDGRCGLERQYCGEGTDPCWSEG